MVGCSDIPCVGPAVKEISEAAVAFAKSELLCSLFCDQYVTTLRQEFDRLGIQKEEIDNKVRSEKNEGKTIKKHVLQWQTEVNQFTEELENFLKSEVLRSPNFCSRYQLGKEAFTKTEKITQFMKCGEDIIALKEISVPLVLENKPKSSTDYVDFESRKIAYNEILEALKNEDGPAVLGIYGMPGAGKTTMMEEAWKQALNEGIFHNVAQAVVSQSVDVHNLQEQLAKCINLHFPPTADEKERARRLERRFAEGEGKKFLVMLDDVWDEVPFKRIGIPFGDDISIKGCKILITSRQRDVCIRNDCDSRVEIRILEKDESWDLFTKIVGTSNIESLETESLARDVCAECAGLPLVIAALGKALKGKGSASWARALRKLRNCKLEEIDGIDSRVYAGLELSFNHLARKEKLCLLLCSLYAEDAKIPTEELLRLALGSGLLEIFAEENFDNIEDARIEVDAIIENLVSSLLLEGPTTYIFEFHQVHSFENTVKLHDIIRDVARSIAARDPEYAFLSKTECLHWPAEDEYGSRKLINLKFKSDNVDFIHDLVSPNLQTLLLECQDASHTLPDSFLNGCPDLRLLWLRNVSFSPTPSSLPKLRSLALYRCRLRDMSFISQLKSLEMLCLVRCILPELPLDLRALKRLRILILKTGGIVMLRHVLASVPNLEELHIPMGMKILDEATNEESPISPELNKLTRLTNLEFHMYDLMSCPDENICRKLHRFTIIINNEYYAYRFPGRRCVLFNYGTLEGPVKTLVERAEIVALNYVKGLEQFFSNSNGEAFVDLTELSIDTCDDAKYLARIPQNHGQLHEPMRSFSKLRKLEIMEAGFTYLFCASVARCLVQLEELELEQCDMMEEIIRNESQVEEDNKEILVFPKLREMYLRTLPKLSSFCRNFSETREDPDIPAKSLFNDLVTFPALKEMVLDKMDNVQCLFDEKALFPTLEILEIGRMTNLSEIWEKQCYRDDSFCQLNFVSVSSCQKLATVVPCSMQQRLEQLEVREHRTMKTRRSPELKDQVCG